MPPVPTNKPVQPDDGAAPPAPAGVAPLPSAEQASLDELRRAYRLLLGSEGAYWERHLVTGEVWYSPRFFTVLGIEPVQALEPVHERVHPADLPGFQAAYDEAVRTLGVLHHDVRYRRADGAHRWARLHGRVWPGANGRAERIIGMVSDVHAERQAQIELQDWAERFNRAMDASQEAHFERVDADGESHFFISNQILTLLGHPAGTPLPSRATYLSWVHPADVPALQQAIRASEAGPGHWECDYRLRHADGGYRWMRGRGRTTHIGEHGLRMTGMVGDIHEQRMAREELLRHREHLQQMVAERTKRLESALTEAQQQRAHAEHANEAKSLFLAHMSHEVRTPLNGLLGLNELALREATSDQQRRYLKLALQAGRGLLDMLNGVLDFSRLSAGAHPVKAEPFDLPEILATCVRQVMPLARVKGLGVMFDHVGDVCRVVGDPQRLQQIASNLLTNAAKFTEQGHIAVVSHIEANGTDPCRVSIEFSDTGPGMTPEVAARVFDPFVQGDERLARRHGGAGLGLSIAQGLARTMGGELTLTTQPGEGASFRLALALPADPDNPAPVVRAAPGHAWLVYLRPVPAQWLQRRLQRLGWTGDFVAGVPEALTRAAACHADPERPRPDLVVLAEGALQTAQDLEQLRRLMPDTRFVLLVRPDWNQPALEAAARALDMPLAFMPLTPMGLNEMLHNRGVRSAAPDSAFAPLDPAAASGADILIAEDNPVNQLIITEMIASLGLRPRLVEDGEQAVTACRDREPSLVLMDLQMPGVDGLEATRRLCALQQQGQLGAFPIVALTAHATPQDRERCLAAGMQGFLTKPISLGVLRNELSRWVSV